MLLRWDRRSFGARLGRITIDTLLSWFMKLSFVGAVPYLLIQGDRFFEAGMYSQARDSYVVAGGAVIALLISLTPGIIARSAQINLPWLVDFVITLVLYLHVLWGGAAGLYYREDLPIPFDKVLHLFSSAMISLLAFMFVFTLYYTKKIRLSFTFMGVFIVLIAVSLGAIWEIMEWSLDKAFGTAAQAGLDDTMIDMIMNAMGGVIAAIGGTLYAKWSKPRHQRRFAIPIAQLLGYLPKPKRRRKKEQEEGS